MSHTLFTATLRAPTRTSVERHRETPKTGVLWYRPLWRSETPTLRVPLGSTGSTVGPDGSGFFGVRGSEPNPRVSTSTHRGTFLRTVSHSWSSVDPQCH